MNPESSLADLGNLATSTQLKSLKSARALLWVIAILTIGLNGYMLMNAEASLDRQYERILSAQGVSYGEAIKAPGPEGDEFRAARLEDLSNMKLFLVASVALGVVFALCAFFILKKPVICSITALVLSLANWALAAALEPSSLGQGWIIKIIIFIVLISAVKAALAYEREERASLTPLA